MQLRKDKPHKKILNRKRVQKEFCKKIKFKK